MDQSSIRKFNKPLATTCVIVNLVLVFLLDAFPFQDLPQHLTYSKIIAEFNTNELFQKFYEKSSQFNSYHFVYYLMSGLQLLFSTIWSFKIIFLFNWASLTYGIWLLRSNYLKESEPYLSIILGSVLIWHGALFMGFLNYSLAIPLAIIALAICYKFYEKLEILPKHFYPLLSFLLLISALLHIFATGMIALLLMIYLFFIKKRRDAFFILFLSCFLVMLFGGFFGSGQGLALPQNILGGTYGFEFVNNIFSLKWSFPPTILNYLAWNFLGPFPLPFTIAGLLGILFCCVKFFYKKQDYDPLLKTFVLFLIIVSLMPWGLYKPTEITFINFRLITVAAILFFTIIPSEEYNPSGSKPYFSSILGFKYLSILYVLVSFHLDASGIIKLIKKIPVGEKVHSVVYENEVPYLARMFRATHFMPMYYMIYQGGVATQFWAGYTKHLPIRYRKDMSLVNGGDWLPYRTTLDHIKQYQYHIIREPRNLQHYKFREIAEELKSNFIEIGRHSDWVVYQADLKKGTTQIGPINKN